MPKEERGLTGSSSSLRQTTMGDFFSKFNSKSSTAKAEKPSGSKTSNSKKDKKKANIPSERQNRKRMWGNWAARDTEEYREHYPGKKDYPHKKDNLYFYTNQIKSKPDGDFIDEIHKNWYGDYERLERHHGYIQWLFPIRESGLNWHSQELQLHEITSILADPSAKNRILKSYEMMLDFYGMKLKDENTGEIERAENWKPRFRHLNRSFHNYLRITRILKCLGEFECEHLKAPFVKFILKEGLVYETLDNLMESCERYWVGVIRDETARSDVWDYYDTLYCEKHEIEVKKDKKKTEEISVSEKPKEKRRKRETKLIQDDQENDDSDQGTLRYAMDLINDPSDSDSDTDTDQAIVNDKPSSARKVHELSDSDIEEDESQEAKYWQENNENGNVSLEDTIDNENLEMPEGAKTDESKFTAKGSKKKTTKKISHDVTDISDMGSDEVLDNEKGDKEGEVNVELSGRSNDKIGTQDDFDSDTDMTQETDENQVNDIRDDLGIDAGLNTEGPGLSEERGLVGDKGIISKLKMDGTEYVDTNEDNLKSNDDAGDDLYGGIDEEIDSDDSKKIGNPADEKLADDNKETIINEGSKNSTQGKAVEVKQEESTEAEACQSKADDIDKEEMDVDEQSQENMES